MSSVNRPLSRPYAALNGLGRAMDILNVLAERPLRARQLADSLELKWTTAYRTLTFLCERGYLQRDESTGVYAIGPRLYYVGSSYVAQQPIVQLARSPLKMAAKETGATVQLVERDRYRAVAIAVFEPADETIPMTTIDFHFPLHCGSKGQVLLAEAGSALIDEYLAQPLEALTPHSITDPAELRPLLARIREQGYAVTRRDVQLSTGSVAAPLRDAGGACRAAICLIVTLNSLARNEAQLVDVALTTAHSISQSLGWRPGVLAPQ